MDTGHCILGNGYWILDTGHWALEFASRELDIEKGDTWIIVTFVHTPLSIIATTSVEERSLILSFPLNIVTLASALH